MPDEAGSQAPQATWGDHLRVAWLLVRTLAGAVPFMFFLPLSPILTPWLKARARKRLGGTPPPLADAPESAAALCEGATVFVVAGEASGDQLAARVIARAREACPGLRVRGYGGPALTAAGADLDKDITSHAAYGFTAVVASLGTWWRLCAETLARFREDPPDVLLTVDFPGLNCRLAEWAKKRGVRTVHLVAPQIWAHTPWRILRWRRAVDTILATFPFEPLLFEASGLHTQYVGHPLFEAPLPPARTETAFPEEAAVVELWPGSRRAEIKRNTPLLVEAAELIERELPATRFVLRLARAEHEALFRARARAARWQPAHIEATTGEVEHDAPLLGAVAASGTATAQLAVDLVPTAVYYRLSLFEWVFAQGLITSPWIALANLVLGRQVLRERLCWAPNAGEAIARDFLETAGTASSWATTRAALTEVRARMETEHVAHRAAGWLLAETAAQVERSGQD